MSNNDVATQAQRAWDAQVMADARSQREHEQEMERLAVERMRLTQDHQRRLKESRRQFLGPVLIGAAIVAVVLAVIFAIYRINYINSQKTPEPETAQVCIQQGNIWHRGDCLITHREEQPK